MTNVQKKNRCVCALLVVALLTVPGSGRSNEFEYYIPWGGGGVVSPKRPHPTIRMDSLYVTVEMGKKYYTVDAVFRLFNTGETTAEWVGFRKPELRKKYRSKGLPPEPLRFDVWHNGVKLNLKEDQGFHGPGIWDRLVSAFSSVAIALGIARRSRPVSMSQFLDMRMSWLTAYVRFPAHNGTTIRTRYQGGYTRLCWGCRLLSASYPVSPGRYWKGRIGKAVFLIDCHRVGGAKNVKVAFATVAGPRLIGDSLLRFEIDRVEPSLDCALAIEVR
jgi:hypothetical protein